MKNLLLAVMLAAAPSAAQEFASDAPAVGDILAKTRALQASSSASRAAAKLLHDIEKTRGNIQKYGDDPVRAGIYKAELGLLYLKLALEDAHGAEASASLPDAAMTEAERRGKHARLLNEIEKMKEKIKTYETDSLRAGIYTAELGLLQAKLALENVSGAR